MQMYVNVWSDLRMLYGVVENDIIEYSSQRFVSILPNASHKVEVWSIPYIVMDSSSYNL
jgi:hypothetical protein